MNDPSPVLEPFLLRLLSGAREGADNLIENLRLIERELSALSLNFNGHSLRAGVRDTALSEIDFRLAEAASSFARIIFDVHQRLLLDVVALEGLARIESVADLADGRPLAARVTEALDSYTTKLGPSLTETRETVLSLAIQLGDLASNTEISACRAAAPTGAAVDVFIGIASQMRTLATRLRFILDDLTVFEQTQQGHAEAVRTALTVNMDTADVLL